MKDTVKYIALAIASIGALFLGSAISERYLVPQFTARSAIATTEIAATKYTPPTKQLSNEELDARIAADLAKAQQEAEQYDQAHRAAPAKSKGYYIITESGKTYSSEQPPTGYESLAKPGR